MSRRQSVYAMNHCLKNGTLLSAQLSETIWQPNINNGCKNLTAKSSISNEVKMMAVLTLMS